MVKKFDKVIDSGKRQSFDTGSKRDTDEGKGCPSLIAGEAFLKVREYFQVRGVVYTEAFVHDKQEIALEIENNLWRYTQVVKNREDNIGRIYEALELTCYLIALDEGQSYNHYYCAYNRLARHYQNGAIKYAKNNWRLGQPVSRFFDSTQRHLWKLGAGLNDEDHPAALLWNLIGIVQTKLDVERGLLPKELNNYPFTIAEVFKTRDK